MIRIALALSLFVFVLAGCGAPSLAQAETKVLSDGSSVAVAVNPESTDHKNAVDQAKAEWPTFAEAFAAKKDKDAEYLAKFKFTDGTHTEHMWLAVTKIDGDAITGIMENNPLDLKSPKMGETVTAKLQDLSDWVILSEKGIQGAFLEKTVNSNL